MNIIAKLTLRHLSGNMKRTIVTILGIATSTALISAILLGIFSFFRFFGSVAVQTDGYGHAAFYEVTKEQAAALKEDNRISTAGVRDATPQITGVRLDSGKEDRFRVGNILHGDTDYFEEMVISSYDGTLPANASEIAVEKKFMEENGLALQIGDTLTFDQGNRYSYDENGEIIETANHAMMDFSFPCDMTFPSGTYIRKATED